MTGLERTLKTLAGEQTDHPPIALHNYIMAGKMMNLPIDKHVKSGELLAKAQINAWEVFGHDVLMIENGVTAMAEALGCEISCASGQPPHVKKCVVETLDDVAKLKMPDPEDAPSLRELLKAVRLIKENIGDRAFIMGRADQGPMALAAAIYGPEKLILDVALGEKAEQLHALIEFCIRSTMRFASAIAQTGADGTCIGGYGTSLISPQIYREYELPYQKIFVEHCHKENLPTGIHTCGHDDPIVDDIASSGADWLEFDPSTTFAKVRSVAKDRCAILGMLNPTGILLNGTPQEVARESCQCLEEMAGTRFVIGPGCALPENCSVENIKALIDAVKNFTKQ